MPALVKILNCNSNEEFCEVRRDRPSVADITIKAQRPITRITGKVELFYRNRWWKLNIGRLANVCNNLIAGSCPVATGAEVTFHGTLSIPKLAQIGMKAPVRIRTTDEKNKVVACVKIMGKVVA